MFENNNIINLDMTNDNEELGHHQIEIPENTEYNKINTNEYNDNTLSGVQKIIEEKIKSEYKVVPTVNPNIYKLDPMIIIMIIIVIGLLLFIGYKFSNNKTDSNT